MKRMMAVTLIVLVAHAARGGTVTRVIDGDTIIVKTGRIEERVRLIGVDAPEIAGPHRAQGDCGGDSAKAQMQVFEKTTVRLYRHGHDIYGRTLAYVYATPPPVRVSPRLKTNSINFYMIANGYARADHRFRHKYMESYGEAEAFAKEHMFGVWRECVVPSPLVTQ